MRASPRATLGSGLIVPGVVAVARVRGLLAPGTTGSDLVAALVARQARRREELHFVYGPRPVGIERASRGSPAARSWAPRPPRRRSPRDRRTPDALPLCPGWPWRAPATSLLASVVARARRSSAPIRAASGAAILARPIGRWLFRLAGVGVSARHDRPHPAQSETRPDRALV